MIKLTAAVILMVSIFASVISDTRASCPVPASYKPVKVGDWVWISPHGWCRVVSVDDPKVICDKPKAPKFDDKTKSKDKQPKAKEKAKPKAPKFDDK